jgi:hypothetical protein
MEACQSIARVQFSCLASDEHKTAREIADAVRAAMQGYVGGEITMCRFIGGGMDLYEAETTRMHHIPIDFSISYAA